MPGKKNSMNNPFMIQAQKSNKRILPRLWLSKACGLCAIVDQNGEFAWDDSHACTMMSFGNTLLPSRDF